MADDDKDDKKRNFTMEDIEELERELEAAFAEAVGDDPKGSTTLETKLKKVMGERTAARKKAFDYLTSCKSHDEFFAGLELLLEIHAEYIRHNAKAFNVEPVIDPIYLLEEEGKSYAKVTVEYGDYTSEREAVHKKRQEDTLECVKQAMEDCGLPTDKLNTSNIGGGNTMGASIQVSDKKTAERVQNRLKELLIERGIDSQDTHTVNDPALEMDDVPVNTRSITGLSPDVAEEIADSILENYHPTKEDKERPN